MRTRLLSRRSLFTAGLLLLFGVAVLWAQPPAGTNYRESGGARWLIQGSLDVASGGELDIESGGALKLAGTTVTATAAEINQLDGLVSTGGVTVTDGVSFTEDATNTLYTGTVEIPAGATIHDVCFTSTALWDGTSASLTVGDDDSANGWFTATNLKATDLLVGEVLCAADDGTWGGNDGAYLTTAGRRGRTTAGVDSGWYVGAATEVIFVVTEGAADGTAGRSFGWVTYSVPSFTAATATAP